MTVREVCNVFIKFVYGFVSAFLEVCLSFYGELMIRRYYFPCQRGAIFCRSLQYHPVVCLGYGTVVFGGISILLREFWFFGSTDLYLRDSLFLVSQDSYVPSGDVDSVPYA